MERPIVGISMGDPFGNGPEITVKALNDPEVYKTCRPLVVGDRSCMEYALAVSRKVNGIDLKLNLVESPAQPLRVRHHRPDRPGHRTQRQDPRYPGGGSAQSL